MSEKKRLIVGFRDNYGANLRKNRKKTKNMDITSISNEALLSEFSAKLDSLNKARQENQLLFFEPVNDNEETKKIWSSHATQIFVTGGNRSSKTDTLLARLCAEMTGIIPIWAEKFGWKSLFQPPVHTRLILRSMTNTWPLIRPKLQWNQWNGFDKTKGHWGWIPKHLLINESWDDSWSAKERILCLKNGSTLQLMSHENEVEDFSGGSFHIIQIDEGLVWAKYRENLLRILDTHGFLMIGMTPPDDEAAAWDAAWMYNEIYQKGLEGVEKDGTIDSFTLFTENNRILSKEVISEVIRGLTPNQREARLYGKFLHLSGRIYKTYTDRQQWWCFECNDYILTFDNKCSTCNSNNICLVCHYIEPFEVPYNWPVVFVLDPHPRKPHAMAWYAINPSNDWFQIGELQLDADPTEVRLKVNDYEESHNFRIAKRLIDPNMGASPSAGGKRSVTVRDQFDAAGLRCDLADDNRDTARTYIKEMLAPDYKTRKPRLQVFNTCRVTNFQMKNYSWDEWTRYSHDERNSKPIPKDLHSDFPTCLGYFANMRPTFYGLHSESHIINRITAGTERGIYG